MGANLPSKHWDVAATMLNLPLQLTTVQPQHSYGHLVYDELQPNTKNRLPQPLHCHPEANCTLIWTRVLRACGPPKPVTQEQAIIHLSSKLRRLTEYQLHKLNIVPELGLTTAMRTVFRIEMHKKWPPPSMTHNAKPPYPSCWQIICSLRW